MAYKRELIINNGSLTSYKKLLKVSDVCQLLDKSKYPDTKTVNGITFTNNGDGSITVNGKIADVSGYTESFPLNAVGSYIPVDNTHKYLGLTMDDIPSGAYIYVAGWKDNSPYHWVHDVGFIGSNGFFYQNTNLNVKYISMSVGIFQSATALYNFNVQPQWFDLTEMYGAGNEPKTVAEFKAKFPNDLYDYSPRCWVKSYKTGLIAKTKNLFDSNNIDTQWLGIQYKSVGNGKILLNGAKESGRNIFPVTRPNITLPAGSYTLSCRMLAGNIEGVEADFNKKIYFGINGDSYTYRCDGVGKVGDYATKTFTLTEDTLLKTFDITAGYTQGFNINNVMIECQFEKGTTATDYVPYGYL